LLFNEDTLSFHATVISVWAVFIVVAFDVRRRRLLDAGTLPFDATVTLVWAIYVSVAFDVRRKRRITNLLSTRTIRRNANTAAWVAASGSSFANCGSALYCFRARREFAIRSLSRQNRPIGTEFGVFLASWENLLLLQAKAANTNVAFTKTLLVASTRRTGLAIRYVNAVSILTLKARTRVSQRTSHLEGGRDGEL